MEPPLKSYSLNTIEKEFSDILDSLMGSLAYREECAAKGIVVAFSGGCDSLALLCLAVSSLGRRRVFPVYVNHNLRNAEELGNEIALNESNCKRLGLELEVCTLEEGKVLALSLSRRCGIEEAARILRYEALESKRIEHSCLAVATAHHRQDQIETVAMRLSSGSPIGSLRGIARFDRLRHLVRPLLSFDRAELEEYLATKGFEWSTDSTNADSSYSRNHFRNDVLPNVRSLWPSCDEKLLSLSRAAAKAVEGFDPSLLEMEIGQGCAWTRISVFDGMNPACRTMALFCIWDVVMGEVDLPMTLAMRVLRALECGDDCRIGANGGVFSLYRGRFGLSKENQLEGSAFERVFDPGEAQCIELPHGLSFKSGLFAMDATVGMDRSRMLFIDTTAFKGKVCIRFAREGDCIRLKGGKRMVRRLLQDMKVPVDLRPKVPVLVDDDGVCAVFGSVFGGVDRICVKFRTSLAPNSFTLYIVEYIVQKG